MKRRTFLKTSAALISAAYVWIPKIAIAQVKGDAREAIIKARTTIASNWDLVSEGSSASVARNGEYKAAISTATAKLMANQYVDVSSRGTEFSKSRTGLAMFGAFHQNAR